MNEEKDIERLIEDLSHAEDRTRRKAALALSGADERAVYPLLKALKDGNLGVQDAAMRSLVAIGGEVVAYMVIPLLREDSYLRNTAMVILRELGAVSVPLLYPLLKDKDEDIRKFSLDLLADIKENVIPEKAAPLVRDPNPNVRAAAVRAVGELRYDRGVTGLLEALKDEEWVCFAALEALGRLRAEGAVGSVEELLATASKPLRLAAVESLGRLGSIEAADALFRHISSSEGEEKLAALKSLVQVGVTPSMSGVGELLREMFWVSGWEEKFIALKGLADLSEYRAVPDVIDVAGSLDRSVPEEEERLYAVMNYLRSFGCHEVFVQVLSDPKTRFKGRVITAELLGEMRCEDAVPVLIKHMESDTRDVRRACAGALANIGTGAALASLAEGGLSDEDGHIRKTSAAAFGRSGDPRYVTALLEQMAREPYQDVRDETVKAVLALVPQELTGRLGELPPAVREAVGRYSQDLETLLALSGDEDLDVRLSALAGLGASADERARACLLEAAGDPEAAVRRAVALAMGEMGPSLAHVLPLLEDQDMWVRVHGARALGRHRSEEALKALRPLLQDPEVPVVLAAVETMAAWGDEESRRTLSALREHPEEAVRNAVAGFLERAGWPGS
ncbi:MAG: HEAT repeat domain-containing protein [Nitrospirota bacterium]